MRSFLLDHFKFILEKCSFETEGRTRAFLKIIFSNQSVDLLGILWKLQGYPAKIKLLSLLLIGYVNCLNILVMFLSKIHCFTVAGAMLNIVQDSALLEAIGCQMEMVRSIPLALLILCTLHSKMPILVILRHFFVNSVH